MTSTRSLIAADCDLRVSPQYEVNIWTQTTANSDKHGISYCLVMTLCLVGPYYCAVLETEEPIEGGVRQLVACLEDRAFPLLNKLATAR
eukprot:scaffold161597_cov31-Prasinocladus_malaysianus.AAC.1